MENRKYKCEGCGKSRPCYVETNQEPSYISIPIENLKCILDETNQTGYEWVEITDDSGLDNSIDTDVWHCCVLGDTGVCTDSNPNVCGHKRKRTNII